MMISFLKNNARKRSHAVVVLFEKKPGEKCWNMSTKYNSHCCTGVIIHLEYRCQNIFHSWGDSDVILFT